MFFEIGKNVKYVFSITDYWYVIKTTVRLYQNNAVYYAACSKYLAPTLKMLASKYIIL